MGGLPANAAQWNALAQFWAGGLASWMFHPLLWPAFGPLRWLAALAGIASQESGFNPKAAVAEANGTASAGIAQFNSVHVGDGLLFATSNDRVSAWKSGWATGSYVQSAILGNPRWLVVLALPVLGYAWLRTLWTGPSSAINDWLSPSTHAAILGKAYAEEERGVTAWATFRLASVLLLAVAFGGWKFAGRKGKK